MKPGFRGERSGIPPGMRSLTDEEESELVSALGSNTACEACCDDDVWVEDSTTVDALEARGLLAYAYGRCDYCGEPDDVGSYSNTPLGKLALDLHRAAKKLSA